MDFIAKLISYLSNPLIIALPAPYIIVYKISQDTVYAWKWEIFSIGFFIAVGLFVAYGVWRGFFSDIDISKREERKPLFIFVSITTILYLCSIVLLKGPEILLLSVVGCILGIVVIALINTHIKASIHVATISAFISSLAILYGGSYLLGTLLIPIIAWSRVKTKRHTIAEATTGGIFGVAMIMVIYFFSRSFV